MARGNGIARDIRRSVQHAEGPAAVLAIGTANPTGVTVPQDRFTDEFFRVTNSDHLTHLKEKLKRICKHMDG
jgi:bisdemethoxycurcumin synthase